MRALFILILTIYPLITFSQINEDDQIIDPIEQMPLFPGPPDSLWCFLESNYNYEILNSAKDTTKYFVRFVIDTTGKATEFEFIATRPFRQQPIVNDSIIRSEILRVFNLMPNWKAATMGNSNIKVRCRYSLMVKVPYSEYRCKSNQAKN